MADNNSNSERWSGYNDSRSTGAGKRRSSMPDYSPEDVPF